MKSEYLFIDTHTPGHSRLGWLSEDGRLRARTYLGRPPLLLKQLFKDCVRLGSAQGVCVVAGPGSFSSIRVGVLYANLLSRLYKKPLIGIRVDDLVDLQTVYQKCVGNAQTGVSTYVAPLYDAEPNITLPKSV